MGITGIYLSSGTVSSLDSLRQISRLFDDIQERLSTGKSVNSPLDEPVSFFVAKSLLSRAAALEARKASVSESIHSVKAAELGVEGILTLIDAARSLADAALSASSQKERKALAAQFNILLDAINDITSEATYKGVALLKDSTESLDILFNEDGGSRLTVNGFDATYEGLNITRIDDDAVSASYGDTANITVEKESFSFSVDPAIAYDGPAVFTVTAKGDYDDANESISWAIDGLAGASGKARFRDGTEIAVYGVDEVEWTQSFTIDGATMASATADESLTVTLANSKKVDTINAGDYVSWTLTYSGSFQWSDNDGVNASIAELDAAKEVLLSESKKFSTGLSIISVRKDFLRDFIETLETGSFNLSAADIEEEDANLLMLEARRGLATSSIGLVSKASESVLSLF